MRRREDERDVSWDDEIIGEVITGAVEDEDGVGAGLDLTADLGKMQ